MLSLLIATMMDTCFPVWLPRDWGATFGGAILQVICDSGAKRFVFRGWWEAFAGGEALLYHRSCNSQVLWCSVHLCPVQEFPGSTSKRFILTSYCLLLLLILCIRLSLISAASSGHQRWDREASSNLDIQTEGDHVSTQIDLDDLEWCTIPLTVLATEIELLLMLGAPLIFSCRCYSMVVV